MSASAAPGVDQLFEKPTSEKTWGNLLAESVGYRGFSKSYALVIGISDYSAGFQDLPTGNDAARMADYLVKEAGFDYVQLLTEDNVTKDRVAELMSETFPNLLDDNDRFLFYWSGHGDTRAVAVGDGKAGYLPLWDTKPKGWSRMIAMEDVQRWDQFLRARQSLFLLDACFGGLAGVVAQSSMPQDWKIEQLSQHGHHVMSAGTEKEQTIASDKWGGSLFTKALLDGLRGDADAASGFERDGIVSLSELKSYVQNRVLHERQMAGWSNQITPQVRDLRVNAGEFFFLAGKDYRAARGGAGSSDQHVKFKGDGTDFRDCDQCPEMVIVPAGSFLMGSPHKEAGRESDEGPQHRVSVSHYALGKYEVTFAEWEACIAAGGCDRDPGDEGWGRGRRPVINVSWDNAQQYLAWLSSQTGESYRLPSESEWEYASRAGTTSRYFWGDDADTGCSYANGHDATSKQVNKFDWASSPCDDGYAQTAPVGSFKANRFALFDMTGNVWEWVEDLYHANYQDAPSDGSAWAEGIDTARVLRGGSWGSAPNGQRSADRGRNHLPDGRDSSTGFRVAKTIVP